jgi:hypothetical protein
MFAAGSTGNVFTHDKHVRVATEFVAESLVESFPVSNHAARNIKTGAERVRSGFYGHMFGLSYELAAISTPWK